MAIFGQANWRYCTKCFGLWFNGNPTNGVCPAGGAHSAGTSSNYLLAGDNTSLQAADEENGEEAGGNS
ncbi:hypothetical protein GO001_24990 [Streptomyces sp. NRRL B-1677]|uniref:Uncharacterized protein n=1 Tax=Streptomyces klenkii TaxID=1420899 RepID=A0A3B0BXG1_9ACTN|nr:MULTISPECIES: hypothetical protein [Streptomyces]MBF6048426.1 hypothetical protein [Streptomyces sp. NRRL B-1677]RKN77682.1 hypothetical protein D7231_02985 [Streptomyces klenkii]